MKQISSQAKRRAHDALRYLRDPRAATAVLEAWCAGFRVAREAPAECSSFRPAAN